MKFIVVFFTALLAVVVAIPRPENAEILSLRSEQDANSFKYDFDTSDDIHVDAEGHLNNVGSENESLVVKGSYTFVGPDSVTYTVNYIADENGFQPQGAHLPVGP